MNDKATISAEYTNLKLFPTKNVAQIILEIPHEAAESFVASFGLPRTGESRWVALALLDVSQKETTK